jgi:formylglycine-generating enzyme required for sulfatase activity
MNAGLVLKSATARACIFGVACCLLASEPNSDEADKGAKPATSAMLGKEAGQVRDDNGLRIKLIWCPPGKFMMGSPKSEVGRADNEDPVEVTLTDGFWLGQTEVTQGQFETVTGTAPWKGKQFAKEGADYVATFVTWEGAMQFCNKLTEQEQKVGRLPGGWEYTLPTEAQWEYGCRAGTTTSYSFGNDATRLGDYAWWGFHDGAKAEPHGHRVGQKKPNPWGLHDMHGNVFEWCRDVYGEKLPGGKDPLATAQGLERQRVVRGGAWGSIVGSCRSAARAGSPSSRLIPHFGFRVALSPIGNK